MTGDIGPPTFHEYKNFLVMKLQNSSRYAGIFLISMATLLLELALTRVLSVGFFYHFGFMVISTAMLGFGIAGTMLAIFKRWVGSSAIDRIVCWLSIGFGVTAVSTYALAQIIPFNPFQLFSDVWQALLFPIYYLLLSIPFLFSGLIISILFTFAPDKIYKLYASDLLGAGLGCAMVALIMPLVGGVGAIAVSASMAFASAAVLSPSFSKKQGVALSMVALILLLFSPSMERYIPIRITEGKGHPWVPSGATPVFSDWNTMSKIEVFDIGPTSDNGIFRDSMKFVLYDGGTAISQILDYRPSIERYIADLQLHATIEDTVSIQSSLAFLLAKPEPSVLIIGSAGGKEVMHSLFYSASRIDAVEINPLLNALVGSYMADYAGNIYRHPAVHVHTENARTFIKRTSEKYDVIIARHTISNAAMASGAMSLAEDYIYTKEAFDDYWQHLSGAGILSLSRPTSDLPRFTTTMKEVLNARGIQEPANHLLIMNGAFYVSKRPMNIEDLGKVARLGQIPVDSMLNKPDNTVLFFYTQASGDNIYHEIMAAHNTDSLYAQYPFEFSPGTDDMPFISHKFKWSTLSADVLRSTFQDQPDVPIGARLVGNAPIAEFVLVLVLVQSVIIAGIMILLPLVRLKKYRRGTPSPRVWPFLLYFSGLGMGFILMEMALFQKYQLYLGQPIYAYALVLGTLLVSTGMGSLLSNSFRNRERRLLNWLLPTICITFLLYYLLIPVLFESTLAIPFGGRVIIASLSVLPLGLLLGMPFPTGLRLLRGQTELIPWAWGVNSFFTVIGTVLAVIVGMTFGFSLVTFIAGMCYLAAWLSSRAFVEETTRVIEEDMILG